MTYPHPMDDKTGFEAADEEMGLEPEGGMDVDSPEAAQWSRLMRLTSEQEHRIACLTLENWQLKGALGYPVPGNIPQGEFKCGLCEARADGANSPAFDRGLKSGLYQAAGWLEYEAERWPQDSLRKRIETIVGDIRKIADAK